MDPWVSAKTSPIDSNTSTEFEGYPSCPKEERKLLQEIRNAGRNIHKNYMLSNGIKATDFALQYVIKNHFNRTSETTKK